MRDWVKDKQSKVMLKKLAVQRSLGQHLFVGCLYQENYQEAREPRHFLRGLLQRWLNWLWDVLTVTTVISSQVSGLSPLFRRQAPKVEVAPEAHLVF